MSAEHSKDKDPLPTRPPRPHPQGFVAVAAAVVAALLALTACGPGQGPAGMVVGKDRTYWSATKQWTYKLTVRKADGTKSTFKVRRSDYNACNRGSQYPGCANR